MSWQEQVDAANAVAEAEAATKVVEVEPRVPDALDRQLTVEDVTAQPTVVGISGKVYRAVNLVTEMTTAHKRYARECLQPISGLLANSLKLLADQVGSGNLVFEISREAVLELVMKVNLGEAFNALVTEELDYRLAATLLLPEDDRRFRPEDVEDRIADLDDLTGDQIFEVFKGFFTLNWSFSQSSFLGFIRWVIRPNRPKLTN